MKFLDRTRELKQNREYVRDLMTLIIRSSENNGIDTQRSKTVSSNRKFEAEPQKSLPKYSKTFNRPPLS
jgi:hypothetical protein